MKFLDMNGLTSVLSKLLTKVSTAFDGLEERVTANETAIEGKVDKVSGKELSTNDYTTAEKEKLAGIATGANKTVVDTSLKSTSTNPVQNKVVYSALNNKAATNHNHYIFGNNSIFIRVVWTCKYSHISQSGDDEEPYPDEGDHYFAFAPDINIKADYVYEYLVLYGGIDDFTIASVRNVERCDLSSIPGSYDGANFIGTAELNALPDGSVWSIAFRCISSDGTYGIEKGSKVTMDIPLDMDIFKRNLFA